MSHDQATGSVVVVMGALSGIGEATALAFAQRGDVLVISGRHDDTGERLARYLKAVGAADAVGPEYDADAMTARVAGSPDNHSAAANIVSDDRATTTGKVVDAIVHLAGTPAI
jgi:NAD(P)-dependent dehydrogenase (short-subunit alcohol dehydrogenase family)